MRTKNSHPFFILYAILILALILLGTYSWHVIAQAPDLAFILLMQWLNLLACYSLLGLGIGLPLVLLASALGWVQLLLLISGNITPHLSREGFFTVLDTLLSKIKTHPTH